MALVQLARALSGKRGDTELAQFVAVVFALLATDASVERINHMVSGIYGIPVLPESVRPWLDCGASQPSNNNAGSARGDVVHDPLIESKENLDYQAQDLTMVDGNEMDVELAWATHSTTDPGSNDQDR